MKVLEQNVNYFLGFTGTLRNYVLNSRRGVLAHRDDEKESIDDFVEMVVREEPDIVFAIEIDKGSIRTRTEGHIAQIVDELEKKGLNYNYSVQNKYNPDNKLSKLPIFKHMGNGVLYREGLEAEAHYLSPGSKSLVYEVRNGDGLSVFSVHLPLLKHFRKKQLRNLAEIIKQREKVIVCGDFNNYYGKGELQELMDECSLKLLSPGETLHNAFLPYRELDVFLCSEGVDVEDFGTRDLKISDHLPTVLEVER